MSNTTATCPRCDKEFMVWVEEKKSWVAEAVGEICDKTYTWIDKRPGGRAAVLNAFGAGGGMITFGIGANILYANFVSPLFYPIGMCWTSVPLAALTITAFLYRNAAYHIAVTSFDEVLTYLEDIDWNRFKIAPVVIYTDRRDTTPQLTHAGDKIDYNTTLPDGVYLPHLIAFAKMCVENSNCISLKKGMEYGLSDPQFRKLKTWAMGKKYLKHKNPDNHRLGMQPTRAGYVYFGTLYHSPTAGGV